MHAHLSPVTTRRSPTTSRRREPAHRTAGAGSRRPLTAAARRTRLDDAIVSQWLLEQLPSNRLGGAADRRPQLAA